MLFTMKELLDRANKERYAIAAPNVTCEIDVRAALEAAEEMNSPIIIDIAPPCTQDIAFVGMYVRQLCEQASIPAALNLDHGMEYADIVQAIRGGFTSVMVDCSKLPFEENVRRVKEVVKMAHAVGVSVEAELGHVGQAADGNQDGLLTEPADAVRFIEETGIDCLAVAIGTAHGAYKKLPNIDFERLVEIKKATGNFPLVLHGSSGSGDENIRRACQLGINKVNIANELLRGICQKVQSADLSGNNAYGVWEIVKQGYKETLLDRMKLYGCVGKSWTAERVSRPVKKIDMSEK